MNENLLLQQKYGYNLRIEQVGAERDIIYSENGREVRVIANFSLLNDVTLFTESLRKWSSPDNEELSPYDYQRVLSRVVQFLSIWGEVSTNEAILADANDLKQSLTERGIPFEEHSGGVISYSVDAETFRTFQKNDKR